MTVPTIAIYGRKIEKENIPTVLELFHKLRDCQCPILIQSAFEKTLKQNLSLDFDYSLFEPNSSLQGKADYLFSIGGDGTLLSSVSYIKGTEIPIVGVNIGRLGFLSSIPREEISKAIEYILQGKFHLDKRNMLEVYEADGKKPEQAYALNDVTLSKTDSSSMISIELEVNGTYFNTYWADGLIISTPTGSTAYNLSCGGPLVSPECNVFIITPIAPHNLHIRPFVLDDKADLLLKIKSRSGKFLLAIDSASERKSENIQIKLRKAPFHINILRLSTDEYINTLRTKMLWGADTRNDSKFVH